MATTGIIYRRDLKANLELDPPLVGEVVYATDTEEYGALVSSALTWRPHVVSFVETFTQTEADALYEPLDSTILRDGDIGVTVQGYSADTVLAPLGVLPALDGSNLTNLPGGGTALDISTDTTNFNNNLSVADTTVQAALDTLDNLIVSGGGALPIDGELRYTAVTDMIYTAGTLTQIVYITGNKANFTYTGTDLTQITYTDTDGLTVLLTLDYTYDVDGNLDTITRT